MNDMKYICIENFPYNFTKPLFIIGKIYSKQDVIEIFQYYNFGKIDWIIKSKFLTLDEYRNNRIKEILND